jgi:hypothetical protein
MAQHRLEQVRAVDATVLRAIVQQDQRSPTFEITDWTVDQLSSEGIANPEGLFRLSGHGRTGQATRPWSVVLKILHKPDEDQHPRHLTYWKRELLAAQSQLLERLPGPVAAPRIYNAVEYDDSGWLWMEHIAGNAIHPQTLAQYTFAARELGRFHGTYLTGALLPQYPWLCTEHCRWWLAWLESYKPESAWENPFVQGAFSRIARARVERLWAEKERFLAVLTQVPQVLSHFDYQRRNLFIRVGAAGQDEVVAIDWSAVGQGALGGDLNNLIGTSAVRFDVEPDDLAELEAGVIDAYAAGLGDAGWRGDARLVRLGYTAWLALWYGAVGPIMTAVWTANATSGIVVQPLGREPEALAAGWAKLCDFALDRGDEARLLMDGLGRGYIRH